MPALRLAVRRAAAGGLLALTAALVWAAPARAEGGVTPRFEPGPCPALPEGYTVNCGALVVPEDRAQPGGREIRLAVAVFKSQQPSPQPDPILFLNGGPGAPAMEDLPRFTGLFHLLLDAQNRDVIIFDQRGVGLSQPALDCRELLPTMLAQAQGVTLSPEQELAPYRACRDRWTAQGVDLVAYSTRASAADANDLWHALGYQQVNLYGVSYGTVLAETIARDYPDGVRSVVLDSAYPLGANLFADMTGTLHAFFAHVFADCAADLICRAAYPQLETVFYETLARLQREPATLHFTVAGKDFTVQFDGADFVNWVQSAPARAIPARIYDIRDGDYSAVSTAHVDALAAVLAYGPPPNRAQAYSVICSQSLYTVTPAQMTAAATSPESAWPERFLNHVVLPLPCGEWPAAAPEARDRQPWTSAIPTLILSGAYDPSVAPDYGARLRAAFTRGTLVTVPDVGHGVLPGGGLCANGLARGFFDAPDAPPNLECLRQPAFRLDTRFVTRAAAVRLPAEGLAILLCVVSVWGAGRAALYLLRQPGQFSWRHSLRAVSWLPAAAAAGWIALGLSRADGQFMWLTRARILESFLPPVAALQAAFIFSPEDEPALEVTLTARRPLLWTVLERLAVLLLLFAAAGLALSGWAAGLAHETFAQTVLRWLPPLLWFAGLGLYCTLVTRRPIFSFALVTLVWFALTIFGDALLKAWPFAWPLAPYLQPGHADYSLNRWLIGLLGAALISVAGYLLRDEESLLLGRRAGRRSGTVARPALRDESRGPAAEQAARAQHPAPLAQIIAMARYEFRLQWRRRAVSVMLLAMIALPVLGAVTLGRQALAGAANSALPASQIQALVTEQMTFATWGVLCGFLTLILPAVVADAIPKDRHFGVRELLDSLPLSTGTYLAGKMLGMLLTTLGGLALGFVVIGMAWRLAAGPFDYASYARLWVLGALPLLLMNPALGLLLAAGQPSNRRALLVGIGLCILCGLAWVPGFALLGTRWTYINPSRLVFFLYFLSTPTAESAATLRVLTQMLRGALGWSIAAGLLETALVYAGVWGWMRWREGR
jgi:pimeloyl-ACP methyl ester carboxylesterase/ABC-type transport system involved in multi-copper enzyme maturation permease subunit